MKARLLGIVLASLAGAAALAQDMPPIDKSGPAMAVSVGQPVELTLRSASSTNIDLRRLPYEPPQKRERPEFEEPEANPGVLPGGPSISPGAAPQSASVPHAPAPPPNITFDGLDFATWGAGHPPDTNGDVGPTYYIQTINTAVGVYRKSDGVRVAAFSFNTLMSQGHFGNLCDTDNFGDPVVLYDTFEDRWVITDFAFQLDGSGNVINPPGAFQCFAVSKTGDPVTGGWNFYSINTTGGLGDYPKFGIWPDGIYMSANMFAYSGSFQNSRVYAFNKAQMYAGSPTVQVVMFNAPSAEFTLLPSNARLQTGTPPAGSPNYFGVVWQYLNAFSVYKFHVDWNHISTSSFTGPFTSYESNWWEQLATANQTAPTPANRNDELFPRLMMQNQYSNIGGVESLWASHTVGAGNPGAVNATATQSAVRFYQVKVTGGTVEAAPTQAWTYSPDTSLWRYMPSVAVDRAGDMAIGYTTSNATTNPALAYAAQTAGVLNNIDQTEQLLWQGTGAQSGNCGGSACTRWGDYSAMTLDPDGCTFWYTNEYYATNGLNNLTRIGSFTLPSCTPVGAGGTVSGTVRRTSDGTPISGAMVTLGSRTTITSGSGGYSFDPIPAGTYPSMSASFPGCVTGTASSIVVSDGGTTTRNFSLAAQDGSACLTDTSQADFQSGVLSNVDLNASPGDVVLLDAPYIDQQNGTVSPTGFGISNTTWAGQTFTPATTGKVTRVDVELFCSGCTAASPNVTVSIRATTGATPLPTGADLATATIAGFNDGGAGGLKTATFSSPITLNAGTRYAFVFRLASSFASGTMAYTCSCATTGYSNSNPYANGQRVTSTSSGSTWTADTTSGGRDLNFRVYMDAGFASSGDFISGIKDANPAPGYTANWTTLSWDAATPASTAVKFQAAASDDINSAFSFVGPDGTASTYFANGASLSQFNGKRYLQYRAYLTTTDSMTTPAINDVTVCYNDVAAAAASIAFGQQPSDTTAGSAVSPPITVRLLDSLGALAVSDNSSQVTLAVASGPGTLSGGGPVTVSGGIATFSNVTFTTAGTYTLTASSGALPPATSTSFVVSAGAANQLAFGQQPSNATGGVAISPAVTVRLQDQFGNTLTTSGVAVTLTANGPGGITSGATANTSNGVATFAAAVIQTAGSYTLSATAAGYAGATSSAFTVSPATASKLAYGQQPSNVTAGQTISPAITVLVEDAFNNVVTGSSASVALAIGANPGTSTLTGGGATPAASGVATFGSVSLNKPGNGYTLIASSAGLTSATSATFNVTAGAPAKLVYTTQPAANANVVAGAAINLVAQVQDANGNLVTSDTSAVTIAIGNNSGGSTLAGTTTVNAVGGIATFTGLGLSLNKVGSGYTLVASDSNGAVTNATSNAFNITPAAANQLAFGQQPTDIVAGSIVAPAVTVRVLDAFGNQLTSSVNVVTLGVVTGPSAALLGGGSLNDSAGVATYNAVTIQTAGVYTLSATSAGLAAATSAPFTVSPATLHHLTFTSQPPASTTAGTPFAVTVELRDQFQNVLSGDTGTSVDLSLGANPGSDGFAGLSAADVAGAATFPGVTLTKAGAGYTLVATANAKTGTSTAFAIAPGSLDHMAVSMQPPTTATAGVAFGVAVQLQDAFNNVLTTDSSSTVGLTLTSNPGGDSYAGDSTQASAGVATFTVTLTKPGSAYRFGFSSGSSTVQTDAFDVVPATGAVLAFLQQPADVMQGTALGAVSVEVRDAFGNRATADNATAVTLEISACGDSTTLGTTTVTNGLATFDAPASSFNFYTVGTGLQLQASSAGLPSTASETFAVVGDSSLIFTDGFEACRL